MKISRRRSWALVAIVALMAFIIAGNHFMGKVRFNELFPPYLIFGLAIAIVVFFYMSPRTDGQR